MRDTHEPAPRADLLLSQAFLRDPYPHYQRMRTAEAVTRAQLGSDTVYMLTRHRDVARLLRDPRLSVESWRISDGGLPSSLAAFLPTESTASMLQTDPPRHTRLRRSADRAFLKKRMADLERRLQTMIDRLLAHQRGSELELVSLIAGPLPAMVVAELLGVPPAMHEQFREWSDHILPFVDGYVTEEQAGRVGKALSSLVTYTTQMTAERRRFPREDLISHMVSVDDPEHRLTPQEVVSNCVLLLFAGHETTTSLLTNGVLALAQRPELFALLKQRPELIGGAVEEMLRFDAPVQSAPRIALEEIIVGEQTIPKHARVLCVLASANRDEQAFPDADAFQIEREPNRHLSFAGGPHTCVGSHLARLEARLFFRSFTTRYSMLRPPQAAIHYHEAVLARRMRALHLEVEREAAAC